MLHSEIDTSWLAGQLLAEKATAKVSCSKTLFLTNSVYTMFYTTSGDTTSKVSSLLSVIRIILMLSVKVPLELPLKMSLPKKKNTVNLKSNYAFTQRFDSCIHKNKAYVAFWREFHFKCL